MGDGQCYGHIYLENIDVATSEKLFNTGIIADINDMWYME